MSGHTPGPWRAATRGWGWQVMAGEAFICEDHGFETKIGDEERSANARLIAAAPDMLDALVRMVAESETYDCSAVFCNGVREIALDAIEKARGE